MASSAISLHGPIGVQDNRNEIINGDFNIWQRGTTVDIAATGGLGTGAANSFVGDRWRVYAQANMTNIATNGMTSPTMIVSKRLFDLGLPSGADNSSKWYLNIFVGNTGDPSGGEGAGKWHYAGFTAHGNPANGRGATDGGSWVGLVQDIEDIRTFENKTCTVSFWAKSDITNQRVAPVLKQMFAGGTAGGSGILIQGSTGQFGHTLDNTWRRYETSFNVPSIEGQPSLGSSGDDALQLQFILHANSGKAGTGVTFELGGDLNAGKTGNISFSQVQLEQGSKVTEFEKKDPTMERLQCCRYHWEDNNMNWHRDYAGGGFGTFATIHFPAPMRKIPIFGAHGPDPTTIHSAGGSSCIKYIIISGGSTADTNRQTYVNFSGQSMFGVRVTATETMQGDPNDYYMKGIIAGAELDVTTI